MMPRKVLACALVAFWILLSGIDVLEDFDLGIYSKIHNTREPTLPGLGHALKIANDTFENGNRTLVAQIKPGRPPASQSLDFEPVAGQTQVPKKNLRIYKLHSAFLI